MANEQRVTARVPGRLAEAVEARAQASGATVADVVRSALVHEVERPIDRRSRAFLESWLAGSAECAEGDV